MQSTYLAKKEHDAYFGMQLATYKIAHVAGNEMHVNTVVVDQSGAFQVMLTRILYHFRNFWQVEKYLNMT